MQQYSQDQLRELNTKEAAAYAEELRRFLVEHVPLTGGHLASNLGIVEISLALAREFSLSKDKIIYDTGHQAYVHKLLTGRGEDFSSLRQFGGISGFPRRSENDCDAFGVGHSSTSISAAVGFAEAHKLVESTKKCYTVAVIGDGAFTGGMVFEALNNVSPDARLIIILNDNAMSISPSVGALKQYLDRIRQREDYYSFMERARHGVSAIPLIGKPLARGIIRLKRRLKRMAYAQSNLFELYGIRYFGPADGNDLKTVEQLLKVAKNGNTPCIIHLHTVKGKGYSPAEEDPSRFHSVSAPKGPSSAPGPELKDFSACVGQSLCALAKENPHLVALTAAMCDGVGLTEFAKTYPTRFFDVGIAEEHATTCCAAMAAGGLLPVFCVYSTFFQRAYDQLLHDISLQGLKTVTVLDRAGIVGEDGPTHHGLYDVSMALNLPGVHIYSPATYQELSSTLSLLCRKGEQGEYLVTEPAIVRVPRGAEDARIGKAFPCEALLERTGEEDADCVILSYGRLVGPALSAAERLREKGIRVAVIKLNCLKPLDRALLQKTVGAPRLLYIAEEGMARGGFGEALISDHTTGVCPLSAQRLFLRGIGEEFVPHGSPEVLFRHCGLDEESMAKEIEGLLS